MQEVVQTALQEDANAIAMTSYQGGHMEYFTYMYDLLKEHGAEHIKILYGAGATCPKKLNKLQLHGIERIYSPDDGRSLRACKVRSTTCCAAADYAIGESIANELTEWKQGKSLPFRCLARLISAAENFGDAHAEALKLILVPRMPSKCPFWALPHRRSRKKLAGR